jgi:hypothetical protein
MTGGGGGVPRPPRDGSDCAKLHEQTTLNSVDPRVLATISKDDVLTVHAETPRGPLLALTRGGAIVGSITSASLAKFLDCIENGFEYVAIVQSVKGGQVIVVVRPK